MAKICVNKGGYSLVEIAIVIVIIGLLTAGVAKGVELIKTSRLQIVAKEMDSVRFAFMTFKGRFGQLPGDFNRATDFDLCTSCNGNNSGKIDISESPYVWMQLNGAGIFSPDVKTRGSNATCARLQSDSELYFEISDYADTTPTWEDEEDNKFIHINACTTTTDITTTSLQQFEGSLTAEEARFIDSKVDDGIANTGIVLSAKSASGAGIGCTRANTATLSDYDLDATDEGCSLSIVYKNW